MPRKSITKSVPAPVGGVNARDSLAQMPETDAVIATNWFGTPSSVNVRSGCSAWATGLPTFVETVMAYNGLTTRKLFAVSNKAIYDVTATGAVGAAVVSGLANSRLQHALFNSGSGTILIWVNGGDTPQYYDGSWHASTISGSGLAASNLITVTVFKNRCWFVEQNTMNVWYSATGAFQGVLTQIPLGQIFKMGGTLQQMATWTIDNVSGMDDYAAFITTEGEVAIYQGYDPSQLSTWSLVGVFRIGRPIGRRCWTKVASDVLVITADGVTPLSKAMLTDRTQPDSQITYKIQNAINTDVQNYNGNFGWQVLEYPLGNKLIVNVPESTNTTMHQWVMNSVTRAWWKFTNWNANCWEIQQDSLYFGGNTIVYLADTTQSDNGVPITCDCKPAFSYFGMEGVTKRFVMARPVFMASDQFQPVIALNVDFGDVAAIPVFTASGTSAWDVSAWDVTPWAGTDATIPLKNWIGIAGLGYAASGRISMQISGIVAQWYSTDYMFEPGGPL